MPGVLEQLFLRRQAVQLLQDLPLVMAITPEFVDHVLLVTVSGKNKSEIY